MTDEKPYVYPPVQFITYAYTDPDKAPVLDSSPTLKAARRQGNHGCPVYRVHKTSEVQDGLPVYSNEKFVEFLP